MPTLERHLAASSNGASSSHVFKVADSMNGIEFDEEVGVKVDKLSDLHHRGLL